MIVENNLQSLKLMLTEYKNKGINRVTFDTSWLLELINSAPVVKERSSIDVDAGGFNEE